MATDVNVRNRRILAVILALVASLALCVWGAAAAGLQITSPIFESLFGRDTVSIGVGADEDIRTDGGGGGGGATDGDIDGTNGDGDTDGDGDGDDDGDGDGNGDDGDDNGDGGNGNGGSTAGPDCFLGLICLSASVDASSDANVDDNGFLGLFADADADNEGITAIVDLDLDANGDTAGRGCLLNLICLNANADAAANLDDNALINLDAAVDTEDGGINVDVDADANVDTNNGGSLLGIDLGGLFD
jgi:hypothetical protein